MAVLVKHMRLSVVFRGEHRRVALLCDHALQRYPKHSEIVRRLAAVRRTVEALRFRLDVISYRDLAGTDWVGLHRHLPYAPFAGEALPEPDLRFAPLPATTFQNRKARFTFGDRAEALRHLDVATMRIEEIIAEFPKDSRLQDLRVPLHRRVASAKTGLLEAELCTSPAC